ncbi:hypothetical protein H920_06627 [Fukomys damarensis]|uniref:Uncharacterized protein n=1 Tax=Fukomys damarensis TaxID=885580 RepID=A0A091DNK1_FUKDA|nr:hypothetical protein H920_06627 [Fukomys damarensis]
MQCGNKGGLLDAPAAQELLRAELGGGGADQRGQQDRSLAETTEPLLQRKAHVERYESGFKSTEKTRLSSSLAGVSLSLLLVLLHPALPPHLDEGQASAPCSGLLPSPRCSLGGRAGQWGSLVVKGGSQTPVALPQAFGALAFPSAVSQCESEPLVLKSTAQ